MNLLFLCTGNSCRSQMAQGWARQYGGDWLHVQSAGIEAHGKNPYAIAVMREAGVDISDQPSTVLTDELLQWADYLVTVCSHANDHCPVLPAQVCAEHWPLRDPASARGAEHEVMVVFRDSRDDIGRRVAELIKRLSEERSSA